MPSYPLGAIVSHSLPTTRNIARKVLGLGSPSTSAKAIISLLDLDLVYPSSHRTRASASAPSPRSQRSGRVEKEATLPSRVTPAFASTNVPSLPSCVTTSNAPFSYEERRNWVGNPAMISSVWVEDPPMPGGGSMTPAFLYCGTFLSGVGRLQTVSHAGWQ